MFTSETHFFHNWMRAERNPITAGKQQSNVERRMILAFELGLLGLFFWALVLPFQAHH